MPAVADPDLAAVNAKVDTLIDTLKKAERTPAKVPHHTAPYVTTGAVGTDSRGFSLSRLLWAQRTGATDGAKDELAACERYTKALRDAEHLPGNLSGDPNAVLLPLGSELLPKSVHDQDGYKVFKAMWVAGAAGADPDEMAWLMRKAALSYLNDTTGGTLVAPPVQGELIDLMRPKEAMINAGATVVGLPPNGRMVFPRQTGPSTMYWVGENTSITESNITTGQVALQAKKGGVYQTLPNELIKYASPAADALVRNDAAKTLALGLDYACLYGSGSAAQPKGLTLYTATNQLIDYAGLSPAPKGVATNGNTLRPEDAYRMIGLIEDRNFEFGGWIFRPSMANNVAGYRADAVTTGDAAGAFVQGLMRQIGDRFPMDTWGGYKVTKSSVVRNDYTKAGGSNLTEVFGGAWEHALLGMFGSVEVTASNTAGSTFQQDQTAVRALIWADFALRYEGAFVRYKELTNSPN
jgi:HK97 family phage major capsid protein